MRAARFRWVGTVGIAVLLMSLPACNWWVASLEAQIWFTRVSNSSMQFVFDAAGSTAHRTEISEYRWDFGDGTEGTRCMSPHTYASEGTYTVALTVGNGSGLSDSDTVVVHAGSSSENQAPNASFTASPSSGTAPLAVTFNASSSSDADGSIASYTWLFGDGATAAGVTAHHTYTSAGTYTARLTVQDDDGATGTLAVQITVSSVPVPQDLYVDASAGSDSTGVGSPGKPFRTITKAASVADAGGAAAYTIHVAAGVYNAGLGEVFPITLASITLVGEGAAPDDVKIVGDLVVGDEATVSRILSYQQTSLVGRSSLLRDCVIDNGGPSHGILIYGGGEVTVQDCVVRRGDTFALQGAGSMNVVGNEFRDYQGLTAWGGDLRIEGNTFYSSGVGVDFQARVLVRGNTFLAGHVHARGQSRVVIESNRIENCPTSGLGIGDSAIADLGGGLLGSTGGNAITGSALSNIEDYRIPHSGPLYAKGNTWSDPQPSGTISGPVDSLPNYSISNEGNSIIFSD